MRKLDSKLASHTRLYTDLHTFQKVIHKFSENKIQIKDKEKSNIVMYQTNKQTSTAPLNVVVSENLNLI